jgi:hypothetical protein
MRTPGGFQPVALVNKPGVYRLLFQSRKKEAEAIKTWVFTKVLPSIRKTGSYSMHGVLPSGLSEADQALIARAAANAESNEALVAQLTRLADLQERVLEATREKNSLARFPPSSQLTPTMLRSMIDELFDVVAEARAWSQMSVAKRAYGVVLRRHEIDLVALKRRFDYCLGRKVSVLDMVESMGPGQLRIVYDTALEYFRDDVVATPKPPKLDLDLSDPERLLEQDRETFDFVMGRIDEPGDPDALN